MIDVDPDYETRYAINVLTKDQANGEACVICGRGTSLGLGIVVPVDAMVPAGWVTDNPSCESQVFRCSRDCSVRS